MPQRSFKKSSDFSSRGKFSRKSTRSDKPHKSYPRANGADGHYERYDKLNGRSGFKEKPSKEIFGEYREHRSFTRGEQGHRENRRNFRGGGRPDRREHRHSHRSDSGYRRNRAEENREPAPSLLIGVRPIEEAIRRGVKFNQLYIQKSEDNQPNRFTQFIQYCKQNKINFFFLAKPKLDELSGHKLHQGVIAELKKDTRIVSDLQEHLTKHPPRGEVVLVLDRLTDQQNVGAIARSAYFFGCTLIISEKTHSAPINEVVHKVSSGASLMVLFHFAEKLSQAINTLKDFGFNIIATSVDNLEAPTTENSEAEISLATQENAPPSVPSIPLREFYPPPKLSTEKPNYAVVMGSEGSGLRPHLERLADTKVYIPRLSDFDSLNVSVATGIVLYAMMQNGFITPAEEIALANPFVAEQKTPTSPEQTHSQTKIVDADENNSPESETKS